MAAPPLFHDTFPPMNQESPSPRPDHPPAAPWSRRLLATAACTLAACGGGGGLPDAPRITGKLPDTGITADQCHGTDSAAFVSCTDAAALAFNAQQDGMTGLDVTDTDHSDGKAGFSYSALAGHDLSECVKDNITGLVWEGKSATHASARHGANRYTHYGDHRSGDASAYVRAVNASGLCGFSDWRLPTQQELQGLIDYGVEAPGVRIDQDWFAHTQGNWYWSAPAYANDVTMAWGVHFGLGTVEPLDRASAAHVRLVR